MTTIARLSDNEISAGDDSGGHDSGTGVLEVWVDVVARTRSWLAAAGVQARDAVILVPFAQLLPQARRAFGRKGGWMPRVETTRTLAAALGPPPAGDAGQISLDGIVDRLNAVQLLRSQAWGDAWSRRDARGFERAAGMVVDTAQALVRAAAALPPAFRQAHWAAARELVTPASGPGGLERLLARVALEWAALAPAPITDRLFDLRPGAWVVLQAGGADRLATRLAAESEVPSLLIECDATDTAPFGLRDPAAEPPAIAVCDGFEEEAQCAAAQVIEDLRRGRAPVALIAQDRVLVRRIRALLERQGVALLDETGWTLSTTRAAALVMSLLVAAQPDAPADALLDWLKALPDRDAAFAARLDAFEAWLRRRQLASVPAIVAAIGTDADSPASALWSSASAILRGLNETGRRPLPDWLVALSHALIDCEGWSILQHDAAGRQVIAALRLGEEGAGQGAWRLASARVTMTLRAFIDWVGSALEDVTFRPEADPATVPEVVITPLPQAMLRPFGAIVFPGADEKHLGAPAPVQALLGDAQAEALGMPTGAGRRRSELLAFGQLLRLPALTLLRRRLDGAEPLSSSPLVARLALALAREGSGLGAWRDPRIERRFEATPIRPSAPTGADLLPDRLSASACEALRACPYRFFALAMLRLSEEDELDGEIEKRDYGTWLHAVLHQFHAERERPGDAAEELAALSAVARASRERMGLPEADFLPFAASFESFAPRYVAWLHGRDAEGWRWSQGEVQVTLRPPEFEGLELRGVIDRIDLGRGPTGAVTELIDYKTGSVAGLKEKVREPLEDTQLAFYAALMEPGAALQASYLALDSGKGIEAIAHPDVAESAQALLQGLSRDLGRIRGGAGMPALGVGSACDYCAARGICRRDHWSADGAVG